MPLRSPIYLDMDGLMSYAEYCDIEVPQAREIIEKTTRQRGGGGRLNVPGIGGADASGQSAVEIQTSYRLEPREKATVSKMIDQLIRSDNVTVSPDKDSSFVKGQLVEVEATARVTAASLAGKMFYILRRVLGSEDFNADEIESLKAEDPRVVDQLKHVYLGNEPLPIPMLIELTNSRLPSRVYVNLPPDHFVDVASSDRVEGDVQVLGAVRRLLPKDSDDGFLSSEEWLLHGWEHLMRRQMMTSIDDVVKTMVDDLELELPTNDVYAYLQGPAILLDAVAIY